MNSDDNVVTMPSQGLVYGVVNNLKYQVVKACAIRGVPDVHARSLANGLQTFQNLYGACSVTVLLGGNGGGRRCRCFWVCHTKYFLCITRAVAVLLAALRHPEHLRWRQRKCLALAPRRDLNAHGHDDVLEIFAIWQRNQRGTIAIRQANADHVLAHIG